MRYSGKHLMDVALIVIAVGVVITNFLVDVATVALDPRIKL